MIKGSLQVNKGIYHVSFRIRDKNGNLKQKQVSTGIKAIKGNKRKAEQRMQEILEQYDEVTYEDRSEMLLADYVFDWIERDKCKVAQTTYDGYLHMFNKHIAPYFREKHIKVKDVKPMHIERYYAVKIDEGLSPNTIIKHSAIIRTAMQDAMKNGIIRVNPVDLADKPKKKNFTPGCYTEEELLDLWNKMQGTPLEMPVYFAIFFGLRRSEAVGVKWSAIDFENGILTVDCKITRSLDGGKVSYVESDTMKTEASKSQYPLNEANIAYLKSVKARQTDMERITDEYTDYVCVNEIGELIQLDYVTHRFKELLEKFGLKRIRFHDLRHSCISLLANNPNFTMKQVQEYARHANYQTTANIYSHVDFGAKASELDAITKMLMPSDGTNDGTKC